MSATPASSPARAASVGSCRVVYSNFRQYASASIVRAAGSFGPAATNERESRPIA